MRKIISLSILLIFGITAWAQTSINQTDKNGNKQGFWQKKDPAGHLLYEGTFKDNRPIGTMKRFYSNGRIKAILNYIEDSDTASATLYNLKQQKIAEGKYLGQQKTGQWNYFNEGQLISSETYKNNLKNGIAKKYYQTGELLEETNWQNNKKDGLYKAFLKNGECYLQCMYKLDQRNGKCISFYSDGKKEMEAGYVNNLRDGEWQYFDEQGKLSYTLIYDKGLLITPEILDSIQNIRFKELGKNKGKIADPEDFLNNPSEYILQNNRRQKQ